MRAPAASNTDNITGPEPSIQGDGGAGTGAADSVKLFPGVGSPVIGSVALQSSSPVSLKSAFTVAAFNVLMLFATEL